MLVMARLRLASYHCQSRALIIKLIKTQTKRVGGKIVLQFTLLMKILGCSLVDSIDDCPSNCFGNGDCVAGTCHCFLGFKGPDCGRGEFLIMSF